MSAEQERNMNGILEKLAEAYNRSLREWRRDQKNGFKDGHMLGFYEIKEAWLNMLDEGRSPAELRAETRKQFDRAKSEWIRDRKNSFKDGRLLACFEALQLFPAAV